MKAIKRLLSVAVCLMMALSLMTIVKADTTNYTITAPSNGHTYEIYQIFTGDLSDGVLSNIKAGTNYKGSDAAADAKTLAAVTGTDAEKLAEITKYVDLTGTPAYTVASGASVSVPAGYYLIKDVDKAVTGNDAYTLYLAKIVGDTTITPKTGTPTVEKKVQDTNDSTGDTTGWQDSADYDIGDEVPYQITATMGDLSAYKTYYVEFTDTMTHLTYVDGSVAVTVNGVDKTSAFTTTWDAATKTLTVKCADVIAQGATSNSKIVVTYKATLDSDANIGSKGNPNTVYLTYSNNPNNSGDGTNKPGDTGETPEDTNIVFTYKVVVNKITEDKEALVGASFKLEKVLADGSKKDLGTIDGTNASTFTWTGIDDGNYILTETVTPPGFNTIDPISFTVEAEHDTVADAPTLTKLSGGKLGEGDVATGQVTGEIINYSGATLPTTGGMGTTMIYVGGASLMAVAAILLVSKKRMATR